MNRRRHSCLTILVFALSLLSVLSMAVDGIAQAPSTPNRPVLENARIRVEFEPATGQLKALVDMQSGYAFVDGAQIGELWQIDVLPACSDAQIVTSEARKFRWQVPEGKSNEIELVWEDFGVADSPSLSVRATVTLSLDEPVALWRLSVDGVGDLRLAAVHFPRVTSIAPQENEVLAAPVWMGEKMADPRRVLCNDKSPRRFEWETPGMLSLQCLTFYRQEGPGLYIASDDAAENAKRFAAFGEQGQRVGLEVVHLPKSESEQAPRYETPYNTIVGTFVGDWFTVAERYRRWGLEQRWAKESRLSTGAIADWATDTGLWVWNRGRSPGVLGPAVALKERTGLPVSVFWHWWHGCSYDTGFPEYLPPREGAEAFRAALRQAHDAGVHAIVYMNQRLWGMTTKSWADEGAEQYAVKGIDGNVHPEVYNTFTKAPCASMCMGTPFWRGKYAGLAEQAIVDLSVDGIYMDQACSSLACYDATHGHPLGGGSYWINGFRLLQGDIRERTRATRQVVLAGEGCGEAWLPYLDLMLSLQVSMERYAAPGGWEPIPFFHAVYHERAVFFGNYSSLTMPPYDDLWPAEFAPKEPLKLLDRTFSQQFRLEQARAFAWGQQPTIANFQPSHFEERAEEIDYVVRLAKLRLKAAKYLQHGTMLRPPVVNVPDAEIDISRLSIYAGQQDALKQYRKPVPAVLASAWQAPDGDVAVVVVNVTEKPQEFMMTLKAADYPIPADCLVNALGVEETSPVELDLNDTIQLPVSLNACEASIYEFAKK